MTARAVEEVERWSQYSDIIFRGFVLLCRFQPVARRLDREDQPGAKLQDDHRSIAPSGMSKPNASGTCPSCTHKVFLVIAPDPANPDYHWYRQDADKTWSHKPGLGPATNVDASGRIIYDPRSAKRDYSAVGRPNYNVTCGFLCAPNR
jgi:hypothetical protein